MKIGLPLLLVFLSLTNRIPAAWQKNIVIHNIEFEKFRVIVQNNDTLSIIGYLKSDKVIEGYPCAADWVHFYKGWKLKLFRLPDPATILNFTFPRDSWILFTADNRLLCVFPQDTLIQGHLCRGGGGANGITTSFHRNGRLASFFAVKNCEIDGIGCKGGVFHVIELHENGALKRCTLTRDQSIRGVVYRKKSRLMLDETGSVVK